jgi:PAS domain-containing protein
MSSAVDLQQLVSAIGDAIMVCDAAGAITLWNPAAERMFGWTEVPAAHKDGRAMSIAFTVALLRSPEGAVTGIAAVIRDETRRFAEERDLRKRLTELQAGSPA